MAAITQEQLDKAVAETRGVLEALLYNEVAGLAKAALGDDEGGGDEGGGADEAPPAAEGSAETPSTSDASPGEAPGEASGQDLGADPAAGGDGSAPSMDQLVQEYAQLPPEELKMHLMAAQAAYEQVAGGAGGDAGAGAPGGAAPPPPGPDAGGGAPPSPGDEISPAMKAELSRQFEALKKSFDDRLAAAIADLRKPGLKVGQRAVTGQNAAERVPSVLTQPKRLTKSELTNRLKELTADPQKLTKAERERINQFYDGGQRDLSLIKNIEGLKSLFQ